MMNGRFGPALRGLRVLCVVLLVALSAGAQTPEETAAAKSQAAALFKQGLEAYKQRKYKDAIDYFRAAHRLYPSPTLSFNTARAYEDMGDSSGALRFFREYLRQRPNAPDRKDVESRISELEQALSKRGIQQVTILSEPDGATVIIDGRPVGVTPWTGEINPGRHRLRLRREAHVESSTEFELMTHRALEVSLKLDPEPVAGDTPAPATPVSSAPIAAPSEPVKDAPVPERRAESRGVSPWTWTAFGIGVAALSGALVFELMRSSSADDVREERTQVGRLEAYDRMEDQQSAARILAVVGGVGMLAGGVLLYLDLSGGGDSSSATAVGVGCAARSCRASLVGAF